MAVRRPPDWAVYAATAAVLLGLSLLRRENADAPPALPAPSATPAEGEGPLLGPVLRVLTNRNAASGRARWSSPA